MEIKRIKTGPFAENTYFVSLAERADGILIDPGDDVAAIERAIGEKTVAAIYLTHFHFDHTISATVFRDRYNCPIFISPDDMEYLEDPVANAYAHDADISVLPAPSGINPLPYPERPDYAGIPFSVIPTPGHSRGSVCLYNEEEKILFSGDTLFKQGIGRMDLTGASMSDMRNTLRKLFRMDEDILVLSGHGDETTIGQERGRYGIR